MAIFVTVGNGKFEPLVKEVDRLKAEGILKEDVMIQLGHGEYKPQHCQWFTFESPLDPHYAKADIVIAHGGPGTVFEVLRRGKKLVATPNRDRTDPNHQVEYLRAMDKETPAMIYCDGMKELAACIEKVRAHEFVSYAPKEHTLHHEVQKFLSRKK